MTRDTIIWSALAFLAGYLIGGVLTAIYIASGREGGPKE